ncbi:MAG: hypothetical protein U0821_21440 [Chloroflexota bacterium]
MIANVQSLTKNVHSILYLPQPGASAMSAVHHVGGLFRLNTPASVETVELHFFTYRGDQPGKLDHGFAVQWVCNSEAPAFKAVRLWDGPNGIWVPSGVTAEVDTEWKAWQAWVDYPNSTVYLSIPSMNLWRVVPVTAEPKPTFGTDVTTRLGFEVISKNGGSAPASTSWRNWFWTWPAVPRTAPVDGRPVPRLHSGTVPAPNPLPSRAHRR